ncbi:MAG TPA: TetR/AcrR family transcriptional regulator [Roseiarcus sp.]|nr:TetR/AcrR family transcriptional regulator [Roseiarcus sp.]
MNMRAPAPEPVESRILAVAAEHVRRFGAARTTIVGVAAEAGMTHANVYRYFPSKIALMEEISAAWLRPLEAKLREAAEGADPAYDKLERMLLAVHRVYRGKLDSDPALFDLLIESLTQERASARKHRARVQSEMQRVVEEGVASGAFAMADRRRALALVFDASHRFLHPVALRLDRDIPAPALAQRFERIVSMTLRALRTGRT